MAVDEVWLPEFASPYEGANGEQEETVVLFPFV